MGLLSKAQVNIAGIAPAVIILGLTSILALLTYNFALSNNDEPKFTVNSLISSKNADEIVAFTQIDLRLSDELIAAVDNGVPIYISVEHAFPSLGILKQVYRNAQNQQYRLERHALSDNYILSGTDNQLRNFDSIREALSYLGQSFKITLPVSNSLNDSGQTKDQIAIRAYLDLKQLPSALRLKHLFSDSWQHDSGWSVWPLEA